MVTFDSAVDEGAHLNDLTLRSSPPLLARVPGPGPPTSFELRRNEAEIETLEC